MRRYLLDQSMQHSLDVDNLSHQSVEIRFRNRTDIVCEYGVVLKFAG